jgi:hypothetical protein
VLCFKTLLVAYSICILKGNRQMMKLCRFGGHQSRYCHSICPEGEELASHQAALFDLSVSEMCKYVVFCVHSCDRKMYELFSLLPLTCIE